MTGPSIGGRLTREQILVARLRALGWSHEEIASRLSEQARTSTYQVGGLLKTVREFTACQNDYALVVWTVDHLLPSQERVQWVERAQLIYPLLIGTKSAVCLRLLELATDPAYYDLRYNDLAAILNKEGLAVNPAKMNTHMSDLYSPLGGHGNRLKLIVVCHLARTGQQ